MLVANIYRDPDKIHPPKSQHLLISELICILKRNAAVQKGTS